MNTLITPITDKQKKQYHRFVEDAADKAIAEVGLDKDGLQKLIENGGEFQSDIVVSIKKHSVSNQFADEEVESTHTYPNGYRMKGITEQTNRLRELFPGIGYADEKLAEHPLPPNALKEDGAGYFAIPLWEKVAPTYGEAVEKVFGLLKQTRTDGFQNYREGQLGAGYLRQHARTVKMFRTLSVQQKGHDILIVSAQFGLRHRGRSVRRAREVFAANEFGLGAFAVGIMLLTHPEREVQWEQLHTDAAGDEFSPVAGGEFVVAPHFHWHDGELEFYTDWYDDALESYGSASGFLPQ